MNVIVENAARVVNADFSRDFGVFGLRNSPFRMTLTENVKFCKRLETAKIKVSNQIQGLGV